MTDYAVGDRYVPALGYGALSPLGDRCLENILVIQSLSTLSCSLKVLFSLTIQKQKLLSF